MANAGRFEYTIGFKTDNTGLKEAQKALQDIRKISLPNTNKTGFSEMAGELANAKKSALELETALKEAFNPKMGTINTSALQKSLSQLNLTQIQKDMTAIGAQGEAAFNKFAAAAMRTNLQLKQGNSILERFGRTLYRNIEWLLSGQLINTITKTFTQAYGFTKNLDASLNDIRIVTGKSADEMARYGEEARQTALTLSKSTRDITDASLIFYQQGLPNEEVKKRTEITAKMSNVTGQSAETVADQMTAVWNGFQAGNDELERYADIMTAIAANTASSSSELAGSISKVAAIANTTGVEMENLSAMLSTVISVTRESPETVGTAFKTIFARINDLVENGSDEFGVTLGQVSSHLSAMGIEILNQDGSLKDLGDTLTETGEKWSSYSKEQQVAIAEQMGGKRQWNMVLTLFDHWNEYKDALDVAKESMGSLQEQQDRYDERVEAHLQKLSTTWEKVYSEIFDAQDLNKIIDAITSIVEEIGNFLDTVGGIKPVLDMVVSLMLQAFGPKIAQGITRIGHNLTVSFANINGELSQRAILQQFGTQVQDSAVIQDLVDKHKEMLKYKQVMTKEDEEQFNKYLEQKVELEGKTKELQKQLQLAKDFAATRPTLQQDLNMAQGKFDSNKFSMEDVNILKQNAQTLIQGGSVDMGNSKFLSLDQDINSFNAMKNNQLQQLEDYRNKIEAYRNELFASQRTGTPKQQQATQNQIEGVNKLINQLEDYQKELQEATQNSDKLTESLKRQADSMSSTANALEKRRGSLQPSGNAEVALSPFITGGTDSRNDLYNNVSQLIESASVGGTKTKSFYTDLLNNIKNTPLANGGELFSQEQVDRLTTVINGTQNLTQIQAAFRKELQATQQGVNNLETVVEEHTEHQITNYERVGQAADRAHQKMIGVKDVQLAITNFTRLAGTVSQLAMTFQQIKNIGNIINDKDMKNSEKIGRVFSSILMMLPMIASTISSIFNSTTVTDLIATVTTARAEHMAARLQLHELDVTLSEQEDILKRSQEAARAALAKQNQASQHAQVLKDDLEQHKLRLQYLLQERQARRQAEIDKAVESSQEWRTATHLSQYGKNQRIRTKNYNKLDDMRYNEDNAVRQEAAASYDRETEALRRNQQATIDDTQAKYDNERATAKEANQEYLSATANEKDAKAQITNAQATEMDTQKTLKNTKVTIAARAAKLLLTAAIVALIAVLVHYYKKMKEAQEEEEEAIEKRDEAINNFTNRINELKQANEKTIRSFQDWSQVWTSFKEGKATVDELREAIEKLAQDEEILNDPEYQRLFRAAEYSGNYEQVAQYIDDQVKTRATEGKIRDNNNLLTETKAKNEIYWDEKIKELSANYSYVRASRSSEPSEEEKHNFTILTNLLSEAGVYNPKYISHGSADVYEQYPITADLLADSRDVYNQYRLLINWEAFTPKQIADTIRILKAVGYFSPENKNEGTYPAASRSVPEEILNIPFRFEEDQEQEKKLNNQNAIYRLLNGERVGIETKKEPENSGYEGFFGDKVIFPKLQGYETKTYYDPDKYQWSSDNKVDDTYNQIRELVELEKKIDPTMSWDDAMDMVISAYEITNPGSKKQIDAIEYNRFLSQRLNNLYIKGAKDKPLEEKFNYGDLMFAETALNSIGLSTADIDWEQVSKDQELFNKIMKLGEGGTLQDDDVNKLKEYRIQLKYLTNDYQALGSTIDNVLETVKKGSSSQDKIIGSKDFQAILDAKNELLDVFGADGEIAEAYQILEKAQQGEISIYSQKAQDALETVKKASDLAEVVKATQRYTDAVKSFFKVLDSEATDTLHNVESLAEALRNMADADYAITVAIDAALSNDFKNLVGKMQNLEGITDKIGEDFIVDPKNLDTLEELVPGITKDMQMLSDGTVQLNKTTSEEAIKMAKTTLEADKDVLLSKIKAQKKEIKTKIKHYERLIKLAGQFGSSEISDGKVVAQILSELQDMQNEKQLQGKQKQEQVNEDKVQNWASTLENMSELSKVFWETEQENATNSITGGQITSINNSDKWKKISGQILNKKGISQGGGYDLNGVQDYDSLIKYFETDYTQFWDKFGSAWGYRGMIDQARDVKGWRAAIEGSVSTWKNIVASYKDELKDLESQENRININYQVLEYSLDHLGQAKDKDTNATKDNSKAQAEAVEILKEELDIYHDINIEIEKHEKILSKLQKTQEKLTGQSLIKNLKEQQAELEILNEKLLSLQELQYQDAQHYRVLLEQDGALFDSEGFLSNYSEILLNKQKEINELQQEYNGLSADEQEREKKNLEAKEKEYEKLKEYIDKYEELIGPDGKIEETKEKLLDNAATINTLTITIENVKYQIKNEKGEIQRNVIELEKSLNKIQNSDILGNLTLNIKTLFSYDESGEAQQLKERYEYFKKQWEEALKTGDPSKEIQAAYQESLTSYTKYLQDYTQKVQELITKSFDSLSNKIERQKTQFETLNQILEHDINIVLLKYGDKAYEQLETLYKAKEKIAQAQITNANLRIQAIQQALLEAQRMNVGEDTIQKYEDELASSLQAQHEMVTNYLDLIKEQSDRTIDEIFDNLHKQIAGVSLEEIKDQWDWINEDSDDYYDTVNGAYEIEKLRNQIQKAINNTDSAATQKALNDLLDNEISNLQQKDKLSKYDIERAQALFDIEQKRAAFREAQNNKSKMRLRRDASGNYSYQFVSDEDRVATAMQDLADAQNKLYNIDKDSYKNNLDTLYRYWEEYQQKLKEAQTDEEVIKINQEYFDKMNDLIQEHMDRANNLQQTALEELEDKTKATWENLTEIEKNNLMGEIVPMWTSAWAKMASDPNFLSLFSQAGIQVATEKTNYQAKIEGVVQENLGVSVDELMSGEDPALKVIESAAITTEELTIELHNLVQTLEDVVKLIAGEKVDISQISTLFNKENYQLDSIGEKGLSSIQEGSQAETLSTLNTQYGWGTNSIKQTLFSTSVEKTSDALDSIMFMSETVQFMSNQLNNFYTKQSRLLEAITTDANRILKGLITVPQAGNNNVTNINNIDANFPAVESAQEILVALTSLENQATQNAFNTYR